MQKRKEKKRNRTAERVLYHKVTSGGIIIPDFRFYYRALAMKTDWYWHKNRKNGIKSKATYL